MLDNDPKLTESVRQAIREIAAGTPAPERVAPETRTELVPLQTGGFHKGRQAVRPDSGYEDQSFTLSVLAGASDLDRSLTIILFIAFRELFATITAE